jgi:acetyl esterase/lipase
MTNGASANIERDIIFGKGGAQDLRLDVYHPTAPPKRTAIIHFHGGGFTRGSKDSNEANCRAFAERGYTSVSAQYRLAPQNRWPDQIHDAKAAIRWTRANASRLDIDPDKIIVAGYSAGGTLALVSAGSGDVPALEGDGGNPGVSSKVAACIAYYAQAERRRPGPDREDALMGADAPDEAYREASGITYAASAVPTIFFHSVADTVISFTASVRLFEAYREAGVPVEMHIMDGLPHVFERRHPEFLGPTIDLCDLFIDRLVVAPRTFPPFEANVATPG